MYELILINFIISHIFLGTVCIHSASWGQLRSYWKEKEAAPVKKPEINGHGNSMRWPRNTLYPKRLALTTPTSGSRLVGIVRLQTTATEFSIFSYSRPDRFWGPHSFLSNVYWDKAARGMKLTAHFLLVPRSSIVELYFYFPLCFYGVLLK
jgi:hypothetical protein